MIDANNSRNYERLPQESQTNPDFHALFATAHWEELLSLYGVYRDYMKHEDDLINQRSTWHLILQGFLFATFGVLGEWQAENGAGFLHPQRYLILYGLAGAGFLISIFAACSIFAANIAIDVLHDKWNKLRAKIQLPSHLWDLIPGIAGAGNKDTKFWGKTPALVIPIVVVVAWSWILVLAMWSQNHPPSPPSVAKSAPVSSTFNNLACDRNPTDSIAFLCPLSPSQSQTTSSKYCDTASTVPVYRDRIGWRRSMNTARLLICAMVIAALATLFTGLRAALLWKNASKVTPDPGWRTPETDPTENRPIEPGEPLQAHMDWTAALIEVSTKSGDLNRRAANSTAWAVGCGTASTLPGIIRRIKTPVHSWHYLDDASKTTVNLVKSQSMR